MRPFSRTHSPCDRGAQHALGAVAEVARMLLGLEAHQIVGAEIGHQLARDRQASSIDGGTKGMCRKKPSGPGSPAARSMRPNGIR